MVKILSVLYETFFCILNYKPRDDANIYGYVLEFFPAGMLAHLHNLCL